MDVEIDAALVEETVFLEVHRREGAGDRDLVARYRGRLEPLYGRAWDHDTDRDLAFRDVHAHFFKELGLDRFLHEILAEFPLLSRGVDRVSFHKAPSRKAEVADLFARPDERSPGTTLRSAVVRVRALALLDRPSFAAWLRREVYHVQDMVDPTFGYVPDLGESDATLGRLHLIRDRYAVLWDAWIEERLRRLGRGDETSPQRLLERLARTYRGHSPDELQELLARVRGGIALRHADLVEWAREDGGAQAVVAAPSAQVPGQADPASPDAA